MNDPFPKPPFEPQQQAVPGSSEAMNPRPDYGENSYRGSGRLRDKAVLITGGDSGIGRAVALAYAREGADLLVSYLNEHEDAEETRRLVESGRPRCLLVAGDVSDAAHCRSLVAQTVNAFGRVDVLSWSPKFGQVVKLGSLLRKTDLDDEQTETVFGGFQGEGGVGGAAR
jgi:short subunit dehydrogenase